MPTLEPEQRAKVIDDLIKTLSPQAQTAAQLWLQAICTAMGERARLRGQRPNFGPSSAKELLFVAIQKGLIK